MDRWTTAEVAKRLGYSRSRIIQACQALGIEKLGRQYALSEDDIKNVTHVIGSRSTGRPKKEPLHD